MKEKDQEASIALERMKHSLAIEKMKGILFYIVDLDCFIIWPFFKA